MGRHGDSTSFIYRHPPVIIPPVDVQRRILAFAKRGVALERICRYTDCFLPTVKHIIDRGVVFLTSNEDPIRCHECGAKLIASPCLRCELLTRNN